MAESSPNRQKRRNCSFLLFPQCFQKTSTADTLKPGLVWGLNMTEKLKFVWRSIGNSVGKGENTSYQHFVLFPHCVQKDSFSRSWEPVEPYSFSRSWEPVEPWVFCLVENLSMAKGLNSSQPAHSMVETLGPNFS